MAAAIANSDSDSYSPKRLMPLLAAHCAVGGAVAFFFRSISAYPSGKAAIISYLVSGVTKV